MENQKPEKCGRCKGTGMIEVSLGGFEIDFEECPQCYGSGYANPQKYIKVEKLENFKPWRCISCGNDTYDPEKDLVCPKCDEEISPLM